MDKASKLILVLFTLLAMWALSVYTYDILTPPWHTEKTISWGGVDHYEWTRDK